MRNGCYKMCFAFLFFKYKKSFKFDQIWMECFISFKTFVFHFYFLACTFGSDDALLELWSSRGEQHFPHPYLSPCAFPVAEHRFLAQLTRVCRCGAASQEPHSDQKSPGDIGGIPVHPACPTTLGCSVELCPTRLQQELYLQLGAWAGGAVNPNCVGKVRPICCPHLNSRSTVHAADKLWHDTANRVSGQPDTAPHAHAKEELL